MLAARIAFSSPDKQKERVVWLEAHKAYLQNSDIRIILSGPFLADDGNPLGALIVAEVADLAELRRFSDSDPFVVSGVYSDISIVNWNVTIARGSGVVTSSK